MGRKAERYAAMWLRAKGWRILAQRVRTPAGEIDLVAKRGKIVAFVEVKARRTMDEAQHSLDEFLDDDLISQIGNADEDH